VAAIPKSTSQTSPGLTAGIFVLHAIQHHRPFQRSLVAKRNVRIRIGDIQEHFPNGPPVGFGKPWQFLDDFGRAHGGNLAERAEIVRRKKRKFSEGGSRNAGEAQTSTKDGHF
jgi:hypothetical protein